MNTRRLVTAIAGSAAVVAAATGLVYALRPVAPTLSLGVLYTLAVLATAVLFGLGFAIATAFASMLAFNFLFLRAGRDADARRRPQLDRARRLRRDGDRGKRACDACPAARARGRAARA